MDSHALKEGFTEIREAVICRVCDRLLYEPYTTECGHTFCYGCLSRWLQQHPSSETCPNCRASLSTVPTPSFVIKNVVNVLLQRPGLLPTGESIEEHLQWQQEEQSRVEKDRKDSLGIFNGMFKPKPRHTTIRDVEDGVQRCPECAWEVRYGSCESCGWGTYSSEDEFGGFDEFGGPDSVSTAGQYMLGVDDDIPPWNDGESDSMSGEDDSAASLDEFVVNDDEPLSQQASSPGPVSPDATSSLPGVSSSALDTSDVDEDEVRPTRSRVQSIMARQAQKRSSQAPAVASETINVASDSEDDVHASSRPRQRRRTELQRPGRSVIDLSSTS